MTLDQIIYVLEISKAGSISKAAKKLLLTQPNLSTSIKSLEDELGFNIFIRQAKGVTLTKKGNEFIEYADSIYKNIKHINNINTINENNQTYTLKIASQFYSFILHEFISVYKKHLESNIDFAIKNTHYFDVLESVYNKSFNIGILNISNDMMSTWSKLLKYKNLEFNPIADNYIRFYILESHPLYNKDDLTFNDLYSYPLITCSHDDIHLIYQKTKLFEDLNNFSQKIAVSDYASLIFSMKEIQGVTVLSRFNDQDVRIFDDFNIKYKSIDTNNKQKMTCGWIMREDSDLSLIEKEFIDNLSNFYKTL